MLLPLPAPAAAVPLKRRRKRSLVVDGRGWAQKLTWSRPEGAWRSSGNGNNRPRSGQHIIRYSILRQEGDTVSRVHLL
jgi:hypothetical protein